MRREDRGRRGCRTNVMPWHEFLPDFLNPWLDETPATAASAPVTAAPAPAPAPAPTVEPGGGLADEAMDKPRAPGSDLVYLGLNDPSRAAEIAALPEGATIVDGSKKQGTVMSADGKRELDLTKEADVQQFLSEAGVGAQRKNADGGVETEEQAKERMRALEAVFLGQEKNGKRVTSGMSVSARDEMAELIQTMQKVENGELDMKRLIISGHHYIGEQGIHGPSGGMTFANLSAVMQHFTGARDGVDDLMLSACNTVNGNQAHDATYKKLFPGLETAWGYNGIAPAPGEDKKNSSPAHIAAWEAASRGTEPQAIQAEARERFRAKVAAY